MFLVEWVKSVTFCAFYSLVDSIPVAAWNWQFIPSSVLRFSFSLGELLFQVIPQHTFTSAFKKSASSFILNFALMSRTLDQCSQTVVSDRKQWFLNTAHRIDPTTAVITAGSSTAYDQTRTIKRNEIKNHWRVMFDPFALCLLERSGSDEQDRN